MKKYTIAILYIAFLLMVSAQVFALDGSDTIRWGVFIGANNGGRNLDELLYADDDALSMAETLTELGGLSPVNSEILIDPRPDDILASLTRLSELFNRQGPEVKKEFIFYYSGHSDSEGMLLGNEKLYYSDVKNRLKSLNADVTVAVLDSCESGAFTRAKGGVHRAPFMLDNSVKTEGHAYLTSSSASEISQESDLIGGSFFTYFLIAGLRGAADSNGDGRVTLNEVYQHTYSETINRTLETGGVQHPTYEINLSGSGDLVMTDIQQPSSVLLLDKTLEGELFIKNAEGQLVLEMNKPLGQDYPLALPAGEYTVQLVHSTGVQKSSPVVLKENQSLRLGPMDLSPVGMELTRSRGIPQEDADNSAADAVLDADDVIRIETEDGTILISKDGVFISKEGASEKIVTGETVTGETVTEEDNDSLESLALRNRRLRKDYDEVSFAFDIFPLPGSDSLRDKLVQTELGFICSAAAVEGIQIGAIGTYTYDYSNMIQVGGIFTIAKKSVAGVQASGFYAEIDGELEGIQASGFAGVVKGDLNGIQASGFYSKSTGSLEGIQASGFLGIIGGKMDGIQASGFLSTINGDMDGIQASGFLNTVKGNMDGIQASGFLNIVTGDAHGLQAGVINIANSLEGVPIGLINLYREGITTIGGWSQYEGGSRFYYSCMTGNDWFYNHFFLGADRYDLWNNAQDYSIGVGLGFRIPLFWSFKLDIDINEELYISDNTFTSEYDEYWGTYDYSFNAAWGKENRLLGRMVLTTDWKIQPYVGVTADLVNKELLAGDGYSYIPGNDSDMGIAYRFICGLRFDFF